MKQLVILIVLLATVTIGYTQTAHNLNCPQCAYSKNRVKDARKIGTADESCGCAACGEKRKKEKLAKQAEVKRRNDAIAAKNKADREAKQKAFVAEQKRKQEEAKKPKSGEVVINAQPSSTNTTPQTERTKDEIKLTNGMANGKLYSGKGSDYLEKQNTYDYFILDSKIILRGQFAACLSISPDDAGDDHHFPENIGIAVLKEKKTIRWVNNFYNTEVISEYPICDIINSKGKRILNDNNITYIFHFYGDWFVLLKGRCEIANKVSPESAEFYNITTKESYPLATTTFNQWAGRMVTCVKDLYCIVQYKAPKLYPPRYRTTGTFKASLYTSSEVYYLTNDDKLEYDTFDGE